MKEQQEIERKTRIDSCLERYISFLVDFVVNALEGWLRKETDPELDKNTDFFIYLFLLFRDRYTQFLDAFMLRVPWNDSWGRRGIERQHQIERHRRTQTVVYRQMNTFPLWLHLLTDCKGSLREERSGETTPNRQSDWNRDIFSNRYTRFLVGTLLRLTVKDI